MEGGASADEVDRLLNLHPAPYGQQQRKEEFDTLSLAAHCSGCQARACPAYSARGEA